MFTYTFSNRHSSQPLVFTTSHQLQQTIQGNRCLYEWKTHIRLPISESYKPTSSLAPFSSYQVIGQILAADRLGTPITILWGTTKPTTTKFGAKNPQTLGHLEHSMAQTVFRYLEP